MHGQSSIQTEVRGRQTESIVNYPVHSECPALRIYGCQRIRTLRVCFGSITLILIGLRALMVSHGSYRILFFVGIP